MWLIRIHYLQPPSLSPPSPTEAKPQLSPQDTASDLLVGHSHDIMCAPLDTVTAVNLSWHINGEPLGSSPKLTVSSTSGSKSSRLHLTNITYADAGRYTCIATNIAGSVQQTTNVIVRGKNHQHYCQRCFPSAI